MALVWVPWALPRFSEVNNFSSHSELVTSWISKMSFWFLTGRPSLSKL